MTESSFWGHDKGCAGESDKPLFSKWEKEVIVLCKGPSMQ